ncbi:EAL domain-containing protein [Pinisolibacter aquiterrae]|uniref:EAL domain-containing response regulator n=1 Tax=Pinisolibacter aquiterrae TaxID=2815579 RepID=UPI001E5E462E|nr:EAL domain-containing response regulator [Pinisolibacter aquiterrae]MCC8233400.1 EAL domain-containing response regulator [Pinisolibacter aquiterrae]
MARYRTTLGRVQDVAPSDAVVTPITGSSVAGRTYVVEDHDLVRSLLSTWFAARGHRVEACPPSRLERMGPLDRGDLVVLDLCLGDRDGVEVLQLLAERRFRGDVILISAFPDAVIETARAVGVDFGLHVLGALRKPLAFDRLEAILKTRRLRDPAESPVDPERPSLAEALAAGRVTFHYQPILDATTLAVVSVEMLARLVDEVGREVSVAGALAGAGPEDLRELARVALDSVAEIGRRLTDCGTPPPPVAINVPSNLLQRRHFAPIVPLIQASPVPITLEVSEIDAFEDLSEARRVTTSAVLRGLRFSLDDFGTFNSNIDRFLQFPFDELKLDRAYVRNCAQDPIHDAVCRLAIELAHKRHATIVAEGVETMAEFVRLRELGVDRVQGYYFSRPLALSALADWIRSHPIEPDRRPRAVEVSLSGEAAP